MGQVLALSLIPPLTTSFRQGVWFGEVVTRLLGLPDPIKTRHVVSTQLKTYHQGQIMLDLQALHAPGLALLRVTLLKTCSLRTSGNLLLNLLLLQNEPTDVGSYMR
jgi:hypothetical protein